MARRSKAKGALLAPDAVTFSKSLRVEPTLDIASDEGYDGTAIPLALATSVAVNAMLLVLLLRSYLRKSESSGGELQDEDMLPLKFVSCCFMYLRNTLLSVFLQFLECFFHMFDI